MNEKDREMLLNLMRKLDNESKKTPGGKKKDEFTDYSIGYRCGCAAAYGIVASELRRIESLNLSVE